MPLNPEEIVNKRFSATKFRQGYDEEEVDEFLDEVVAELRRLNGENEELRGKLTACESRVSELSLRASSRPEPTSAKVAEPAPSAPAARPAAAAPTPSSGVESAAGMLALAQRLHDEHIEAGKSKGAKLVSDAQEQAARMVREAEEKQRQTLGTLETQRQALERKVEDLRAFEREYRSRLKAYLENQLRELEGAAAAPSGRGPQSGGVSAGAGTTPLPNRTTYQGGSGSGENTAPGQDEPRFPFTN